MARKNHSTYLFAFAGFTLAALIGFAAFGPEQAPDPIVIDPVPEVGISAQDLAQCLADAGVHFYHARWCGHCETQKDMFGSSLDLIESTDCAVSDRSSDGFTQECLDNEITSVPAWVFPDGTKLTGVQTFETLADQASCSFEEPEVSGPVIE
jgi:large repetitive protein